MTANINEPTVDVGSAEGDHPSRRVILTGAAWTLPVIATAVAAPMAAASGEPSCIPAADAGDHTLTLAVTGPTNLPLDPAYSPNPGYYGPGVSVFRVAPGTINFTTTLTYVGPEPLPVGTTIELAGANNPQRSWLIGGSYSGMPAGSLSAATAGSPGASPRRVFTTLAEIPAGTTITFSWWLYTATNFTGGAANYGYSRVTLPDSCEESCLSRVTVSNGRNSAVAASPNEPGYYYNVRH